MTQNERISHQKFGMIFEHTAHTTVWGLLTILVMVIIAGGLVDIYRLFAARNWAYSLAQEAALIGASRGRDWNTMINSGSIQLDSIVAISEAQNVITSAMQIRGISRYFVKIQVLPDPCGGTIKGFPPRPVRMGEALGDWSSDEPAVGVYIEVPVTWFILDFLEIGGKSVSVFASAGVAQ